MKREFSRLTNVVVGFALVVLPVCRQACAEGVADEAAVPCRDWQKRMWLPRFEEKRVLAEREDFAVAFVGDSITHNWEAYGTNVWRRYFAEGPYKAVNFGIGGDRTENVLWRLRHGQLGRVKFKAVVLMIGTNNVGHRTPEDETPLDTVLGVKAVLDELQKQLPEAKVILHPILPRGQKPDDPLRVRTARASEAFRVFADGKRVLWCDFNDRMLAAGGILEKEMAPDFLHPRERGYEIWAEALKPYLDYAIGAAAEPPAKAKGAASGMPVDWIQRGPQYPVHKIGVQEPGGRLGAKRREIRANAERYYDIVMMGDSITHFWEVYGPDVLRNELGAYRILDVGCGSGYTGSTLWLAENGFLDSFQTKLVTLMIGTNDLSWGGNPESVDVNVGKILEVIRRKQPLAKVLLFPILPRGKEKDNPVRLKCEQANELLRRRADGKTVVWVNMYGDFLKDDGTIRAELFNGDLLHPAKAGYEVWARVLKATLEK